MISLQLQLSNKGQAALEDISMANVVGAPAGRAARTRRALALMTADHRAPARYYRSQVAEPGVEVLPFTAIPTLEVGASAEAIVNVDFNDKVKAVKFDFVYGLARRNEITGGTAVRFQGDER